MLRDFETMDSLLMEQSESFSIEDSATAEWAARKIFERNAERDRLISDIDDMLAFYGERRRQELERCSRDNSFLISHLERFFDRQQQKATKTQATYRLASCTLVRKFGGEEYTRDKAVLTAFLKTSGNEAFIKTVEEPDWAAYKKQTRLMGDVLVDMTTGEVVQGVTVTRKPDVFDIKEV